MLVGGLVGAFTNRSTITRAVLVLGGFTATFGLGWGAVTLIELAIGYAIGNFVFGRRPKRSELQSVESQKPQSSVVSAETSRTHTYSDENIRAEAKNFVFVDDTIKCFDCSHLERLTRENYQRVSSDPRAEIQDMRRGNVTGPAMRYACPSCGSDNLLINR